MMGIFGEPNLTRCEAGSRLHPQTWIRRPHQGESRRNFSITFCVKKLEWWGYQKVKKSLRIDPGL